MTVIGHIEDIEDNDNGSFTEAVRVALLNTGKVEVTAKDIVDSMDGAINASQASTALSYLRNNRKTTGIVRISQGVYSYQPDNLDKDMGDVHRESKRSNSHVDIVRTVFTSHPGQELTSRDIQKLLDPESTFSIRQISQAISNLVSKEPGLVRVGAGRYVYRANVEGVELDGIGDKVPDDFLIDAGLNVVARAQDGSRVAVDENGVAWLISIRVEGRLL